MKAVANVFRLAIWALAFTNLVLTCGCWYSILTHRPLWFGQAPLGVGFWMLALSGIWIVLGLFANAFVRETTR